MTIAAILRHKGNEVISVRPDASIAAVAALLDSRRIGAVVVQDEARTLLGILSERDIIHAIATRGPAALDLTADQLMTRNVQTAGRTTTLDQAMRVMSAGHFRHLPVEEDGALIGVVSIRDVVEARIVEKEHEVATLRDYVGGRAYAGSPP